MKSSNNLKQTEIWISVVKDLLLLSFLIYKTTCIYIIIMLNNLNHRVITKYVGRPLCFIDVLLFATDLWSPRWSSGVSSTWRDAAGSSHVNSISSENIRYKSVMYLLTYLLISVVTPRNQTPELWYVGQGLSSILQCITSFVQLVIIYRLFIMLI